MLGSVTVISVDCLLYTTVTALLIFSIRKSEAERQRAFYAHRVCVVTTAVGIVPTGGTMHSS